jgi:hypothetical protein
MNHSILSDNIGKLDVVIKHFFIEPGAASGGGSYIPLTTTLLYSPIDLGAII